MKESMLVADIWKIKLSSLSCHNRQLLFKFFIFHNKEKYAYGWHEEDKILKFNLP